MEMVNHMREMFDQFEKEFDKAFSRPMFMDLSNDNFFEIFTEKRIEMLKKLQKSEFDSIRQFADMLQRDVKNVHNDLCLLQKHNLIGFERRGRAKIPKLLTKTVILNFR